MKVGILTLKLHSNFGYLMQAYALQKVLRDVGHDPYHFYIKEERETLIQRLIVFFKKIVKNIVFGSHYVLFPYHPTSEEMEYKDKNTWDFIKNHIQLTPYIPLLTTQKAKRLPTYDAYIVGSDQVWRREYTDDILCYFFNFTPNNANRMAYAASFGTNELSYSSKAITECKELLKRFSVVTVREDDGVRICREYFDCTATKVLDPTLLLSMDDYLSLIDPHEPVLSKESYIFTYILRPNKEKYNHIKKFAAEKGLKVVNIMPEKLELVGRKRLEDCKYPSISTWLNAFLHAEYVLTDSFHASVFSIIFKKQFYVMNDRVGGSTRIPSLLNTFNISNRDINAYKEIENIDYENVSPILNSQKKRSRTIIEDFLKNCKHENIIC